MAKTRVKKVVISGITSEQAEIAFSEFAKQNGYGNHPHP